jgi:hypothetical protein
MFSEGNNMNNKKYNSGLAFEDGNIVIRRQEAGENVPVLQMTLVRAIKGLSLKQFSEDVTNILNGNDPVHKHNLGDVAGVYYNKTAEGFNLRARGQSVGVSQEVVAFVKLADDAHVMETLVNSGMVKLCSTVEKPAPQKALNHKPQPKGPLG